MEKEEVDKEIKEARELNEKIKEEENLKEKDKIRDQLGKCYQDIKKILHYYIDVDEDYYSLIAMWIIGTYFHEEFKTYPYLFFNAMKGTGKTRTLKLTTFLSDKGQLLNSLTEAVLFRTEGTLGIDEFEGITRRGNENLRELLNSAYKKGTTVKRLKKVNKNGEENQVIEEFDVFRPIVMANIWGMEEVLGDRCISIIIEKSSRQDIIRRMENFEDNELIKSTLDTLNTLKCSLCGVVVTGNVYKEWDLYLNDRYLTYNNTNSLTQHYTNNITNLKQLSFFNKIHDSNIDGRNLELAFPLLTITYFLSEEIFEDILRIIKKITDSRIKEEFNESKDISLIDFVSQYPSRNFVSVNKLTKEFKDFLHEDESEVKWINPKWMGRGLKRLKLILDKRRLSYGVEVRLDIDKAQLKIKMFQNEK